MFVGHRQMPMSESGRPNRLSQRYDGCYPCSVFLIEVGHSYCKSFRAVRATSEPDNESKGSGLFAIVNVLHDLIQHKKQATMTIRR